MRVIGNVRNGGKRTLIVDLLTIETGDVEETPIRWPVTERNDAAVTTVARRHRQLGVVGKPNSVPCADGTAFRPRDRTCGTRSAVAELFAVLPGWKIVQARQHEYSYYLASC